MLYVDVDYDYSHACSYVDVDYAHAYGYALAYVWNGYDSLVYGYDSVARACSYDDGYDSVAHDCSYGARPRRRGGRARRDDLLSRRGIEGQRRATCRSRTSFTFAPGANP